MKGRYCVSIVLLFLGYSFVYLMLVINNNHIQFPAMTSSMESSSAFNNRLQDMKCGDGIVDLKANYQLRCEVPLQKEDNNKYVVETVKHHLSTTCPCAYDGETGMCHRCSQYDQTCAATKQSYFCRFTLTNVIVTGEGGLIDCATMTPFSFVHPSMGAQKNDTRWAQYYSNSTASFLKGPFVKLQAAGKPVSLPSYDVVISTRMIWDTKFTHASFQSVPFIALAHLAYQHTPYWSRLTWHASMSTAALLVLLGIPRERIAVGRTIYAKHVLLPWIPYWSPPHVAAWHGIASKITHKITSTLLTGPFQDYAYSSSSSSYEQEEDSLLDRPSSLAAGNTTASANTISRPTLLLRQQQQHRRSLVVYLTRPSTATRHVTNEQELLSSLRIHLDPSYEVVVLDSTVEHHSIKRMHMSWVRYASALQSARVVIGPHGGALNNLIFTANDMDIVEFNMVHGHGLETPTRLGTGDALCRQHYQQGLEQSPPFQQRQSKQPAQDVAVTLSHPDMPPIRYCFLHAAWAKGLGLAGGRYWIIPPSRSVRGGGFYDGRMRVSVHTVLTVFRRLGLLRKDSDFESVYPKEPFAYWNETDEHGRVFSNRMNSGARIHYRRSKRSSQHKPSKALKQ